ERDQARVPFSECFVVLMRTNRDSLRSRRRPQEPVIRRIIVDVVSRDSPDVVDARAESAGIVGAARAGDIERSERARGSSLETVTHAINRVRSGDVPLVVDAGWQCTRTGVARHAELPEDAGGTA